ncbi:MAG: hypothetical protein MZU79_00625 [Anaerotruncus sp.]|nr:hypothetical protein [Anaerotruncus sp.]
MSRLRAVHEELTRARPRRVRAGPDPGAAADRGVGAGGRRTVGRRDVARRHHREPGAARRGAGGLLPGPQGAGADPPRRDRAPAAARSPGDRAAVRVGRARPGQPRAGRRVPAGRFRRPRG